MIKRYIGGESITAIAKDADVSRQAVIKHLKRAGVHKEGVTKTKGVTGGVTKGVTPKSGGGVTPKSNKKPTPVSPKVLQRIDQWVKEGKHEEARGEVYCGDNVYFRKGKGFYWKRWVRFNEPLEDVMLGELNDTFIP